MTRTPGRSDKKSLHNNLADARPVAGSVPSFPLNAQIKAIELALIRNKNRNLLKIWSLHVFETSVRLLRTSLHISKFKIIELYLKLFKTVRKSLNKNQYKII